GNRAILAITQLHRTCRSGRSARRRLPPAIPAARGPPISALRDGPLSRIGESAVLPVRRHTEDDLEWNLRRIPPFCSVEDHGRHEQIGALVACGCGMDSGGHRWADRLCRATLPGGRLVTSWRPLDTAFGHAARVQATAVAALLAFVLGVVV